MSAAYQPERWHDAFVMFGGASAVILGFLFVAASIRADVIIERSLPRRRLIASSTNALLLLVESGLILAPQNVVALGIEVMTANILAALLPVSFITSVLRERKEHAGHLRLIGDRVFGYSIVVGASVLAADALGVIGGIGLVGAAGGGMYWLLASFLLLTMLIVRASFALLFDSTQ